MIYCVEDDASIRELVLYTLRASGFEARGFAESGAFWEAMCEHVPDLVLLDIMLPGEDGLEILKKLRSSPLTEQLPVILATARGSEYDKVVGLDTGADDYLAKPFGMMEMVSRVWDADYAGETRTVDVHVGTLRTKLAECGGLIETVRGVGYKMEGVK